MINLENICQSYFQGNTKINVLNGMCLKVKKGQKIGIVGPSGSGKTTLLNIIGLLESPKQGNVILNHVNCNLLSSENKTLFRRKNIGYIFQNNQLLEDFSVLENVALPLILNNFTKKKSLEKAKLSLDMLGILNKSKFKPGTLSGGEQQRVAIARAIIKEPLLLIADEPTGSLDEDNTENVMNIIITVANKLDITLVMATHNLNLIKKMDKCYKVDEGLISEA